MKKLVVLFLSLALLFSLTACGEKTSPSSTSSAPTTSAANITKDRAGNDITLPAQINKVVSLAPAYTSTMVHLGLADKIVGADSFSLLQTPELDPAKVVSFDMMALNAEQLIALQPDVVIQSSISDFGSSSQIDAIKGAGICVINIPSSNSITAIKEDVQFIADVFGKHDEGVKIVSEMQTELDRITKIAATIPVAEKKTVYFELGTYNGMNTFGSDVFLNEMIELIGAVNIFADQTSWVNLSAEEVVAKNPDVILVNWDEATDVNDVKNREGFSEIAAVKNNQVYHIDNNYSSQPNEYVVLAIDQMAKAVYPEYYS